MRRPLGLLGAGLACAWLQGTLATFAPPHFFPDLVLLWAVGVAVAAPAGEALLVAAALGYAADLLSGALLGQHALLLVLACSATRVANVQLNLMRTAPRVALVAALSVGVHAGHAGLARLFTGTAGLDAPALRHVALQTALNAALGPAALALAGRLTALLGREEESLRRTLRLRGVR